MNVLNAPLRRIAAFQETDRMLRDGRGPVQLAGCVESQKVQVMHEAGGGAARLVVTSDEKGARTLYEDWKFFSPDVYLFPEKDLLFYQADVRSDHLTKDRVRTIRALTEALERGTDIAVITTMYGAMNILPDPETFRKARIPLAEGDTVEPEALVRLLVSAGYTRTARVENPGEFAFHGSILDLFDLTEDLPVRIEFWDDEIDTIRTFSPESQITIERKTETVIYPASELFPDASSFREARQAVLEDGKKALEAFKARQQWDEGASMQQLLRRAEDALDARDLSALESYLPYFYRRQATILDYFPENAVRVLEEPSRLAESGQFAETEYTQSFGMRLLKGLALPGQAGMLKPFSAAFAALCGGRTLLLTGLDTRVTLTAVSGFYSMECRSVVSYRGDIQSLVQDLKRYVSMKYSIVLLAASRVRGSHLEEELREYGLKAYYQEVPDQDVPPAFLLITRGNLHRGFLYPNLKFVVLTENDLFGAPKKARKKHRDVPDGQKIKRFSELSAGDYVVHENYGIGIYRGIRNIENEGVSRDYMEISYGDSGTLYIPVTNLDVVQKYASQDAKPPKLSRLDSPEWKRTRGRVRQAVDEVAEELVALYAARQNGTGHRFREDTPWQQEFEELFPFEETEDQLTAIEEVKKDMESGKIMDRLLCGDVGFGKTEVALRAAFKAVQEGKQVAYLVPTTILAKQHYNTFLERMHNYPVTVELLSRFRTEKEQQETLKNLKSGMCDIVIGTHRILSKDVRFRDLGLLVIDEEQRFGVRHKERIKELKTNVDVLTLTATPIPRTLHMSMIGVRDMSVLTEPPEDRQAIQTYVMEYQEELVREAISRELARGGQVYYVYNRVQDIRDVAAKVQALVPDASVAFAHGKMTERELERTMLAFIEGSVDVLVSTTIIETGLDIPNVNTIIIQDGERYGLSQLYQLRGRVGRSARQAYAFIMYRKNRVLNEEAEKRLEAIRQFTELGSGIRIAMQDLEIRGAGTVLGNAQSGHMALVGYELYCKMLEEAVRRKKGQETQEEETFDTVLDIRSDAYIPSSYIPNESLKLEVYKKISLIGSEEDRENLCEELEDRYGDVPEAVSNLMMAALIREKAHALYMTSVKGNAADLTFRFHPAAKVRSGNIPALITEMGGAMRFLGGPEPGLNWRERDPRKIGKADVTETLNLLLDRIKELLI